MPYNCYVTKGGYVLPKAPAIKLTKEIINWLSTADVKHMFKDIPNACKLEGDWLTIGISNSHSGNLYAYASASNNDWFTKFNAQNPYVKVFDDFEGFKKYMTWVSKLGPKFVKQNFNNSNK